MKGLILIGLAAFVALMFSGCVIVDGYYHYGHRPYGGVIITDVPPPPPVVLVRPAPYGPPHHYYYAPPPGRRDFRR
jgi:hypothetical protein